MSYAQLHHGFVQPVHSNMLITSSVFSIKFFSELSTLVHISQQVIMREALVVVCTTLSAHGQIMQPHVHINPWAQPTTPFQRPQGTQKQHGSVATLKHRTTKLVQRPPLKCTSKALECASMFTVTTSDLTDIRVIKDVNSNWCSPPYEHVWSICLLWRSFAADSSCQAGY